MLLVPTYIDISRIHGFGLFASCLIAKGTTVCRFVDGFDRLFTQVAFDALLPDANRLVAHYGYKGQKYWYLNLDNMRFANRWDTPSLLCSFNSDDDVAARDIEADEELTVDYFSFDCLAGSKVPR